MILGTVAGWQRSREWNPDNRIYEGVGYLKMDIPPRIIDVIDRYEYKVTMDIKIFFCDSTDLAKWLVIRDIKGIKFVSIYGERYPNGLKDWIKNTTTMEAEELSGRSRIEMSGLTPCTKAYDIIVYDEEEIQPAIFRKVIKIGKSILGRLGKSILGRLGLKL